MTREEAIEIFEHNWTCLKNHAYTDNELDEALEIAIEALKRDAINTGETVTSGYIEPVGEDNNVSTKTTTVYSDNNDGMIAEMIEFEEHLPH